MANFLLRRTAQTIPTLLGITLLVFMMVRFLPGDPATFIGGENIGEQALQALRAKLGLDKSLPAQLVDYITRVARGDFGRSLISSEAVTEMLLSAVPVTLLVTALSLVLGFLIAVPLGALAAFNASKGRAAVDQALTVGTMIVDTVPAFWMALIFMLFFTLKLGWLPSSGSLEWGDPVALLRRIALPVMVLGVAQLASVARITRTAVLDVLNEDYVRTARAVGTPELHVLFGHALRNAALPIVTVAGLSFGRLLGGTVILESIFALPGMGTVLISAIYARDYPVVQGAIFFYTLIFIAVNLVTDVLYTRIDPRVQL